MSQNRKVTSVILLPILVFLSFCNVFVEAVFARVHAIERSEDELLIFEVYANDALRSSGMLAYLPEGADISQTLLPVTSVARALSFSIQSDPVGGGIDGWFFSENNVLQVDILRNTVLIKGNEYSLSKGDVEVHYDDIYVRANVLEDWLGIKFRPDVSMLRLYMTSQVPLPFEEEESRKKRAEDFSGKRRSNARDFAADKLLPYQLWSKPSLVLQHYVQGRRAGDDTSFDSGFSLQSSFDAMHFGTKFLLSGTLGSDSDPKIDNSTLTFERRDSGNGLLGRLKAGAVSFGDVSYPDVPLTIGRKRGRGIAISSDSKYGTIRSFEAETFNVDGDAPVGWDAELYRNGYFVAFQDIGTDGRYNFEDVELVRGFNLIQIILYGPEGQRRTETQRIIRGQDVLREGEVRYEVAVGQPEADFIPLAENARSSSTFGGSAQVSYGVKDYLTIGTNAYSGEDASSISDDRQSSVGGSAVFAFAGVKTGVQYTKANEGRDAYGIDVTTQVEGTNITVARRVYNGFDEDDRDLVEQNSIDMNRNFKRVSVSGRAEHRSFQKKDDELNLEANLSTNIGRFQFANSLDRVLSDNEAQERFDGEFSVVTGIRDWRLRGNLRYDLGDDASERLRRLRVSGYRRLGSDSTLRLNGDYDFMSEIATMDARYTKDFDQYSIDFNVGTTNDSTYFGGITFRTGLQADDKGKYHVVSARDGGLGSVGLRAFIDRNGNLNFDEGERLVKGVSFRSNRGDLDGQTSEDGTIFLNGLPEGPTIFYLQESTLPSIYLKPVHEAIEIIPRIGATTTIDVAFVQLGEIDGFVYVRGGEEKPMPGAIVILYDAQTGAEVASVNSEYDGYYIFSALPMGDYRVEVLPVWDDGGANESADVRLSYEEPIVTDVNLEVSSPQFSQADMGVLIGEDAVATFNEFYIHLGSMSSLEGAEGEQRKLWAQYPELEEVVSEIRDVRINGRVFYRILGVVSSKQDGQSLCNRIMKRKAVSGGCSVLKLW